MAAKGDPAEARDSLREWLRRGDPVSEGVPDHTEMRRLRAGVLRAAAEQAQAGTARRSPFGAWLAGGRPVHAPGAAAALALAVVSILWLAYWRPSTDATRAGRTRTAPVPAVTPHLVTPAPEGHAASPSARPAGSPPTHARWPAVEEGRTAAEGHGPGRSGVRASTARDALARSSLERPGASADERKPLQVQFTTPGGTRIIWVLNPDLALQPLQQED